MIFSKLERGRLDTLEANYKHLSQQYYDLWRRHEHLLSFLGVTQYERPPGIVTERKGGPEKGEA